jgi:hypothetical protein
VEPLGRQLRGGRKQGAARVIGFRCQFQRDLEQIHLAKGIGDFGFLWDALEILVADGVGGLRIHLGEMLGHRLAGREEQLIGIDVQQPAALPLPRHIHGQGGIENLARHAPPDR